MATYICNSDQLKEVYHFLQVIHVYATTKRILFKMQMVPISNFNLVSAEASYQDLRQAHFALVSISGGPALTAEGHVFHQRLRKANCWSLL